MSNRKYVRDERFLSFMRSARTGLELYGQERMYGQFEVKHVRLSFNVRTNVGVRTYAQDNMKMRHIIVRTYETVSALE